MAPEVPSNISAQIEQPDLQPPLRAEPSESRAVIGEQPNPLHALRRRQRGLWLIAALMLCACAWWAFQPIKTETTPFITDAPIAPSAPLPSNAPDAESSAPLDPNLFAVNLWNPVPPPAASVPPQDSARAEAAAPPPAPLNIQLIGIITDQENGQSIQKAALYDADSDRLLIIADGDHLRNHIVRVLAGGVVELTDGRSTKRLILRPDSHDGRGGQGGAG